MAESLEYEMGALLAILTRLHKEHGICHDRNRVEGRHG